MFEVYDAAAAHGMTTIGGQDPDVGLGGHLTGGGHAPISGVYGLAADNVLEIELITPSGEIKTTNPCTDSDLWFALRGVRPTPLAPQSPSYLAALMPQTGRRRDIRRHPLRHAPDTPHPCNDVVPLRHRHDHANSPVLLASRRLPPHPAPPTRQTRPHGLLQHQLRLPPRALHAPNPRRRRLDPEHLQGRLRRHPGSRLGPHPSHLPGQRHAIEPLRAELLRLVESVLPSRCGGDGISARQPAVG